jgi:predicted MFS family arabinose efflux permease
MAVVGIILAFALPHRRPEQNQSYASLLASLFALPFNTPVLRHRALYQSAAFACFTLYWTGVPLLLAAHFGYTQRGIALFALVGAAGAFAAPIAGRLADRNFGRIGTVVSLLSIAAAFALALLGGACSMPACSPTSFSASVSSTGWRRRCARA